MKRPLLLLALVAAPHFALAQPDTNAQAQPDTAQQVRKVQTSIKSMVFAANPTNARAIALMGAFYNTMQNAPSARGHYVLTQTSRKDGQITGSKTLNCDFVWQKDAQGTGTQSRDTFTYSTTLNGTTSTERLLFVDDGQHLNRAFLSRDLWTQSSRTPSDDFGDLSQFAAFYPWVGTLLRIVGLPADATLANFQIQTLADASKRVTSLDGRFEALFNLNGTLKSWRGGDTTTGDALEVRFDHLELGGAVPAEAFAFAAPQGAKQVAREAAKLDLTFNWSN